MEGRAATGFAVEADRPVEARYDFGDYAESEPSAAFLARVGGDGPGDLLEDAVAEFGRDAGSMRARADAYLRKPFDPDLLLARIEQLLELNA